MAILHFKNTKVFLGFTIYFFSIIIEIKHKYLIILVSNKPDRLIFNTLMDITTVALMKMTVTLYPNKIILTKKMYKNCFL